MATTTARPPASSQRRRALRPAALLRPRAGEPAWARPALIGVLLLAAVLCCWDIAISGNSNTYYAAAVKSASEDWKAWFFGSLDPGSFITVDKPPLSIWLMGLSARIFGFGSASMLLPDALCTVAAVGLLYATVKRAFGPAAGIAAALVLATTPITVAIARVNNPDALLILLLVASAFFTQKAIESGKTKHLAWAGAMVGLAFMTKMLQGWMVVPALAAAYLLAGKPALGRRLWQLAVAGVTMVVVSAAWPVAVTLWPGSKPYIGGSTDGSVWNLILGYNGLGRLTGNENGMGGGGGASFGGLPGIGRLFNEQVGAQIAWLLPLAAVSLVAGLWLTRRGPRTDVRRASLVLFGLWAIVHVLIFSTAKGTFHPYYTSALAPAIAALSGIGVVLMGRWATRAWAGVAVLGATIAGTAWLAVDLLDRTPDFAPWLRVAIPVAAAVAIALLVAVRAGGRRLAALAAVVGAFALGAAPASYAIANVGHSLNGNNVLAGPSSVGQGGMGGFGGGGSGAMRGGTGGAGGPPSGSAPGGGAMPGGSAPNGASGGTRPSGTRPSGGGMGAMGGGSVSGSLISYLEAHQGSAKYLVAVTGSQQSAPIILQTGKAVVTIGGFSGSDDAPTVSGLAAMVRSGELKYILLSGSGGGPGGGSSAAISAWVEQHGTAVSGVSSTGGTLYELSA
ncbi:MAG TPA: glycosyltransferase family 39 protein [Baekduia sp.]|uniref:ArnT family glycosyltransferase n=1 Tax=Baekduia sp. TaxID=2600305 RepID=UPI002D7A1867|nr:glycosyltransferase family 39 protein [Baekduia sp.]HET6510201.1 glycosyltransferase family 39 protein [Baekduia sp.]